MKGLKKQILKQKFNNKKKIDKKRKVSLRNLIGEQIELESKQINLYLLGINKILQTNIKTDSLVSKVQDNLQGYFRFCRFTQGKLSFRCLQVLFSLIKSDLKEKTAEKFMTLLYESLLNPSMFQSKNSEMVFDLLFNAIQSDFSQERQQAFISQILKNLVHCESRFIISGLILIQRVFLSNPTI